MRPIASVMLLTTTAILSSYAATKGQSYMGEIMDSQCAIGGGSHDAMMSGNPKLKPKSCTLLCVTNGAKFVLYEHGTNTIYQLDDQKKSQHFAGEKVIVTGTLDDASKTIQIASIKIQEIQRFAPHGW